MTPVQTRKFLVNPQTYPRHSGSLSDCASGRYWPGTCTSPCPILWRPLSAAPTCGPRRALSSSGGSWWSRASESSESSACPPSARRPVEGRQLTGSGVKPKKKWTKLHVYLVRLKIIDDTNQYCFPAEGNRQVLDGLSKFWQIWNCRTNMDCYNFQ